MNRTLRAWLLVAGAIADCEAVSQELKPTQIFENNGKNIVLIVTFDHEGKAVAQGSGVVLQNNLVATNCHVVTRSALIGVERNGSRRIAKVEAVYAESDLCVLVTNGQIGEAARIAPGKPRAGERVYALGHPKGLDLTISEGLVSGFRTLSQGALIQFSAAISAGSSGGGLFNSSGELVGITTSTLRESQNINFAAPVDILSALVSQKTAQRVATINAEQDTRDQVAPAPPVPEFVDSGKRIAYLRWLGRQSDNLQNFVSEPEIRREFLQTVWYESARAGLKPELVLALIQNLSGYKKFHVRTNGGRGYMQIVPRWTKILSDGDAGKLFHVQSNLRFGCVILRHFYDVANGDIESGLRSYLAEASGLRLDRARMDSLVHAVLSTSVALEQ